MKSKEYDLIDLLIILAKNKKTIIIFTLIVSIISVIYAVFSPQYWVSSATFKPLTEDSQGFDFSASLLSLGGGLLGGNNISSASDYIAIMNSRNFSRNAIEKFDLINYFEIENEDTLKVQELAMKNLHEQIMGFGVNLDTGNINLSAETKDKYLSRDIVNWYIDEIEYYNQHYRKTKGKIKREFLEERVQEVETNIEDLKNRLQVFQEESGAIEITQQTISMIELYSKLLTQKFEVEIDLLAYESNYDSENIKVNTLKKTLAALEEEISKLETKPESPLFINFSDLPKLTNQYTSIILQLEIQKKVYEYIYPQFESAKLDELKDSPTIEVINSGNLPGYRSKPKRAIFCILMFLVAVILSSLYVLLSNTMPKEHKDKLKVFIKEVISK